MPESDFRAEPDHLQVWLLMIDVNSLTDSESSELSAFDVNTEEGVASLVNSWMRPLFDAETERSKKEMIEVLMASRSWPSDVVSMQFGSIAYPYREIGDPNMFMNVLRREFLG